MSRRKTFPSLSSSRQMMTAWKVSGLSHSPAIIASRPASMRLAMAISPSRESSSTEPISRKYMRTGSSVRSDGSFFSVTASDFAFASTTSVPVSSSSSSCSSVAFSVSPSSPSASSVSTTLMPISESIAMMSSICSGEVDFGRQHGVERVEGDEAALLGGLDHLLDAGVVEIEQRQRRIGRALGVLFRGLFLHLHRLRLARHCFLLDLPGHVAARPIARP